MVELVACCKCHIKEPRVLILKLLNAHSVHYCVSFVGRALNLLQRLESKVFNKDA